jgi:peptide/nickel transport system substrate-binding protein
MRHLEQIGEGDNGHQCLGGDIFLALGLGRRGTLLIRWRLGVAEGRPGGSGHSYSLLGRRWQSMGWRQWIAIAVAAACALAASACGRSASAAGSSPGTVSPVKDQVAITPPGTKPVPSVVWATNRDLMSLDPALSYGYPEFTADSLMCESLLRQAPDGSMEPGLATVANPSPTIMVFTLRPGVEFWDGHPVTPADVVYSLDRQMNPKVGVIFSAVFNRVKSIAVTGSNQVTITLKQPDYWLEGELASMRGIIIEKSFAEKQGKNYGTPAGSIMCTGAYMLKSWAPGVGVVAVRNPHYWNRSVHPLVGQITIKGVPDIAILTAGLQTGAIQGAYLNSQVSTLTQLEHSGRVRVYLGPGWTTDMFAVSSLKGVLGSLKVRQALSLALNRQAIIDSVYDGAALMPRWLSNPGTFGYSKPVFTRAYDSSPVLAQNIAQARKLVKQAGATGKTLTIGTTSQLAVYAADTGAWQAAAQAIGLKVVLRSVPIQGYVNFLYSAQARAGIDGFPVVDYGEYADPAALLSQVVLPGGLQNLDGFNDPAITAALEQARSTASPEQRAALVAKAEQLTMQQLPWIPDVQPDTVLVLDKGLTGAVSSSAYLTSPWADHLGGTG